MQLLQVNYPDKPPRFFIDGVRVARETYDFKIMYARQGGKEQSCLHTKCIQLEGGTFKRFNYSSL